MVQHCGNVLEMQLHASASSTASTSGELVQDKQHKSPILHTHTRFIVQQTQHTRSRLNSIKYNRNNGIWPADRRSSLHSLLIHPRRHVPLTTAPAPRDHPQQLNNSTNQNTSTGNAVTQTFMTIPALVEDFPPQGTAEYASRSALLGRQWPLCWQVGNVFFRPMSTLSTLAYAYCAWDASRSESHDAKWQAFAVAAALGVGTIVHSAVNMQPLNDRLAALADVSQAGKEGLGALEDAEGLARKWGRWNLVRVVFPLIGGGLALSQVVR